MMNSDLEKKLLSGIVQSTKPARVSYKPPKGSAVSPARVVSACAVAIAVIGLILLVSSRLKFLF
jgi:hypothetical protein